MRNCPNQHIYPIVYTSFELNQKLSSILNCDVGVSAILIGPYEETPSVIIASQKGAFDWETITSHMLVGENTKGQRHAFRSQYRLTRF